MLKRELCGNLILKNKQWDDKCREKQLQSLQCLIFSSLAFTSVSIYRYKENTNADMIKGHINNLRIEYIFQSLE